MANGKFKLSSRRMGRSGQSAVFDAVIFFIILASASALIYIIPTTIVKQNEDLLLSQYKSEVVDSTLKAVLRSTINSTSFVKNDDRHDIFDIDVHRAIQLYMELKYEMSEGITCNLTELRTDIGNTFKTAIPPEYEFSLNVTFTKGATSISEIVTGEIAPKSTKYSSSLEVDLSDAILVIVLSIWN